MLGGIFNVIVAPFLFDRTWEYHLVLILALLARPWPEGETRRAFWIMGARAAGLLTLFLLASDTHLLGRPAWIYFGMPIFLCVLAAAALGRAPLWLAACLGTALAARSVEVVRAEGALLTERSFFGRFTVIQAGDYHALYHGSTLHGAQNRDPAFRREPITYYVRGGPVDGLFAATAARAGRRRVAVVGLGTGSTAAYATAGEEWTYYEIDPGIERIARDTTYFTYLADSPARTRVVLGDARLSLAEAPDGAYDLILLDAFSSDAIPMHLLTREAMGLYLSKLAPGGLLVYHLSNRYLDLEPVLAAQVVERGLRVRVGEHRAQGQFRSSSTWAVVARTEADLGPIASDSRWRGAAFDSTVAAWTDDFSSILSVWGR